MIRQDRSRSWYPESTRQLARQLRRQMTPAERVLWEQLRNHRLDGYKFRRQHPIGPFIVDFCSPALCLVVEIDGDIHDEQPDRDLERAAYLAVHGYQVIRFRNEEVLQRLDWVLSVLRQVVASRDTEMRSKSACDIMA